MSVPPENTLIAWRPRHTPTTGSARSAAAAHASASSASRSSSTPSAREAASPVAAGIDVRAAGEQEPVHRGEGLGPGGGRQPGVDDDRLRPVPGDGLGVVLLLAHRERRIGARRRVADGDDDARCTGWGHRRSLVAGLRAARGRRRCRWRWRDLVRIHLDAGDEQQRPADPDVVRVVAVALGIQRRVGVAVPVADAPLGRVVLPGDRGDRVAGPHPVGQERRAGRGRGPREGQAGGGAGR